VSTLTVRGVAKAFGSTQALAGVDLTVQSGALVAVLGPSGCGKTTLLRCIAGFERIDRGEIALDDHLLASPWVQVPPHRRRIAVVPQEGALFPHLSVAGNVAYGLDRAARRSGRVAEVLALVGLAGYEHRMPHELSGGQQQRVAVARALAPRPPLVLLDEPFSALDASLRAEIRADVRQALRADNATAILVTHDQDEALSTADQVTVMRAGRMVQSGAPIDVYREPVDEWVASFVGDAVLIPGTVRAGVAETALGRLELELPHVVDLDETGHFLRQNAQFRQDQFNGGRAEVTTLIRPEQVLLGPLNGAPTNAVAGTVLRRMFHGHDELIVIRLADGTEVLSRALDRTAPVALGESCAVWVRGPVRAWARRRSTEPADHAARPHDVVSLDPHHVAGQPV
jgi:iron(III) transport system ATP-binding protein